MGSKEDKRRKARLQRLAEAGRELVPSREAELARKVERKLPRAGGWPLVGTWVNAGWQDNKLATVVVARRRPDGDLAGTMLLVDPGCLGVKNADVRPALSTAQWSTWFEHANARTPLQRCEPEQAASIVAAGSRWASKWGLPAHPLARAGAMLLAGLTPETVDEIPVGLDGKPLFVNGPRDDVPMILAHVDRVAGRGNYHYMLGDGDPGPDEI